MSDNKNTKHQDSKAIDNRQKKSNAIIWIGVVLLICLLCLLMCREDSPEEPSEEPAVEEALRHDTIHNPKLRSDTAAGTSLDTFTRELHYSDVELNRNNWIIVNDEGLQECQENAEFLLDQGKVSYKYLSRNCAVNYLVVPYDRSVLYGDQQELNLGDRRIIKLNVHLKDANQLLGLKKSDYTSLIDGIFKELYTGCTIEINWNFGFDKNISSASTTSVNRQLEQIVQDYNNDSYDVNIYVLGEFIHDSDIAFHDTIEGKNVIIGSVNSLLSPDIFSHEIGHVLGLDDVENYILNENWNLMSHRMTFSNMQLSYKQVAKMNGHDNDNLPNANKFYLKIAPGESIYYNEFEEFLYLIESLKEALQNKEVRNYQFSKEYVDEVLKDKLPDSTSVYLDIMLTEEVNQFMKLTNSEWEPEQQNLYKKERLKAIKDVRKKNMLRLLAYQKKYGITINKNIEDKMSDYSPGPSEKAWKMYQEYLALYNPS